MKLNNNALKKLTLCLLLAIGPMESKAQGLSDSLERVQESLEFNEAKDIIANETHSPVQVGVHDVSFLGCKTILDDLINREICPPLDLLSPHGSSVVQILKDPIFGLNPTMTVVSLSTGIFKEDFLQAVQLWREREVKVVNISMSFRSPEIIAILNQFIDEGGIVIASSGNSRLRLGEAPKDYYRGFNGLLVGASNLMGQMEDFSQYLAEKTILAPGSQDLIEVERLIWNTTIREEPTELNDSIYKARYKFGMTSAAAPVVTAVVSMALQVRPHLTQKEVNKAIMASATMIEGKPFLNAAEFMRIILKSY